MIDPAATRTTSTPDGLAVAWVEGGDPDGYPVIGLHGTPGCRWSRWPDDSLYADAGVRYVTLDRAGYGRSTRRAGRVVADGAREVAAVAEALGLAQYAVVGGSGGGPQALACAALLDRVSRVACQSSLAPVGVGGMTRRAWLAGMAVGEAGDELAWAEAGEDRVRLEVGARAWQMRTALGTDPADLLGEMSTDGDREFLARADLVENWRRIVAEQTALGVDGWVDDTFALTRPWGFSLASIEVPVLLSHGEQDRPCPLAHAQWLAARIRAVTTDFSPTGGHLPERPEAQITATMQWLRGEHRAIPPATRNPVR